MDVEAQRKIRLLKQENQRLSERNDLLEKTIHGLQDELREMLAEVKSSPLREVTNPKPPLSPE